MDQRITIKIAEREYVMTAPTPEGEELIRMAAATINSKINGYLSKYPGKNMVDILSFVALNESIGSINLQRRLDSVRKEAEGIKAATDSYLKNIGDTGR